MPDVPDDQPLEFLRPEAFGADDLIRVLGAGAPVRPTPPTSARRLFCDTFDGRLYRRNEVLESVQEPGTEALLWRRLGGGVRRRLAVPAPRFARDLPPGPFRRRLEQITDVRALLPLVRVETRSRALELRDGEGKVRCRIFVEEHRAGAPLGDGDDLCQLPPRVRVEPVRGYAGEARGVFAALKRVPDLRPVAQDVLFDALTSQGREPPTYSSKVRTALEPDLTAAEGVRLVLLGLLDTLEANEEGTRAGWDPEFLHDFRVAVRRTRSALGQLKAVFPPATLKKFRAGFGWLGALTGPARDLDVHLLELPEYRAALPPEAKGDLEPLKTYLEARQQTERRALARTLGSRRYRSLVGSWRAFLETGSEEWQHDPGAPDAGRPVHEVAGVRIRKVVRRALRQGLAIGEASPPEHLHELRKTCKKLRYLLEFFRSLYPAGEASALIAALKGLQDNLGAYQDVHVQAEALRGFARETEGRPGVGAPTHLALGMLLERLRGREAELRAEFARRFAAFAADAVPRRFPTLLGKTRAAPDGPSTEDR